jgi:hypothetical protein
MGVMLELRDLTKRYGELTSARIPTENAVEEHRMPTPIALCIERLEGDDHPLTGCVAVVGREPGLSLEESGEVLWKEEGSRPAIRLCVAQDGRLVLLREQGALALVLARSGRSLDVMPEKPVFVVDGDEVALEKGARLRLHVHGAAEVRAPWPVKVEGSRPGAPRWLLAGAAVVALGATAGWGEGVRSAADASAGGADARTKIEVREHPPAPPLPPPQPGCGGCSKRPSESRTVARRP